MLFKAWVWLNKEPIFALFKTWGRLDNEPILRLFTPEFGSVFQVGVPCPNTSVSPLSLWERARVRGF